MSRMILHTLAPSTFAAVMRSLGIDSSADVKMIIPKDAPTNPLVRITNVQGLPARKRFPPDAPRNSGKSWL